MLIQPEEAWSILDYVKDDKGNIAEYNGLFHRVDNPLLKNLFWDLPIFNKDIFLLNSLYMWFSGVISY